MKSLATVMALARLIPILRSAKVQHCAKKKSGNTPYRPMAPCHGEDLGQNPRPGVYRITIPIGSEKGASPVSGRAFF